MADKKVISVKQKYSSLDLCDVIHLSASIDCSICGNEDDYIFPQYAELHFFKKGWRVTKSGKVYCPDCAKKKLKI